MRLFVTGASGFLGRYVVTAALEQGHTVRAMVRPATSIDDLPWAEHDGVQLSRVDLRDTANLGKALEDVDVVIHAAAVKSGDLYSQLAGTVVTTENLLHAMDAAGVGHIVGISSFAVYDYLNLSAGSVVDEATPLEARVETRDAYCQTKLLQEELIREHATDAGWRWTILRPGVIYGPENTWTGRLGFQLSSSRWVRTGSKARLPLTYVENCAEAIVLAAERAPIAGAIYNVLDDNVPNQSQYMSKINETAASKARITVIPWWLARGVASVAWWTNRLIFKGEAKVPGLLVPARLSARCRPLRYSNRKIKEALGWSPRIAWEEGVRRSVPVANGRP